MKKESSSDLERVVFKPFKIEGRVIYPVVDIFIVNEPLNILNVSPVALIVNDIEDSYILNLTCKEIDDDELFELLSSFKKNIEK